MEDAVEIGCEHAPPFVLGTLDEGLPARGPHARIGETAVDPAESLKRSGKSVLDRRAIGDVAGPRLDPRFPFAQLGERDAILLRIAAPDRNGAAGARERLRHAEADPAIASGDNRNASGKIEIACHGKVLPRVTRLIGDSLSLYGSKRSEAAASPASRAAPWISRRAAVLRSRANPSSRSCRPRSSAARRATPTRRSSRAWRAGLSETPSIRRASAAASRL